MRMRRDTPLVAFVSIVVAGACALALLTHLPTARSQAQTANIRGRSAAAFPHARSLQQAMNELHVGLMFPPDCNFQPLTTSNPAAGRATAVFSQIPSDLSQSVSVEYPPCSASAAPAPTAQPQPDTVISFQIVSLTRYVGSSGTVYISVMKPSAGALTRGLDLGSSIGARADGTTLYANNIANGDITTQVQWMQNGLVITVAGSLPADRLEALAKSVDVRT